MTNDREKAAWSMPPRVAALIWAAVLVQLHMSNRA